MPQPKPNSHSQTDKNYQQLGRLVASIYESGYLDRKQTYKMSFMKGLMSGAGGVVGATVLIALLLWILSFFSRIPLIGHISHSVQQTVQQHQK